LDQMLRKGLKMVKHICDWCGDEVPLEDLFPHRGPSRIKLYSVSDTTGKKLEVEFVVFTDGVSNSGDYHTLCVLRMIVHQEASMRQAKESNNE
jgi:hypothetical protein